MEHTGGSVNYYRVKVEEPTSKDIEPYTAECNDIIECLNMTYAEANVFKAIWRKCAERELGLTKKGNNQVYDAEKCVFFSSRILEVDKKRKANKITVTYFDKSSSVDQNETNEYLQKVLTEKVGRGPLDSVQSIQQKDSSRTYKLYPESD